MRCIQTLVVNNITGIYIYIYAFWHLPLPRGNLNSLWYLFSFHPYYLFPVNWRRPPPPPPPLPPLQPPSLVIDYNNGDYFTLSRCSYVVYFPCVSHLCRAMFYITELHCPSYRHMRLYFSDIQILSPNSKTQNLRAIYFSLWYTFPLTVSLSLSLYIYIYIYIYISLRLYIRLFFIFIAHYIKNLSILFYIYHIHATLTWHIQLMGHIRPGVMRWAVQVGCVLSLDIPLASGGRSPRL